MWKLIITCSKKKVRKPENKINKHNRVLDHSQIPGQILKNEVHALISIIHEYLQIYITNIFTIPV